MIVRTLALLLLAAPLANAAGLDVRVLSAIDESGLPPDPTEKLVRFGTTVTLHAVVLGSGLPLLAAAPTIVLTAGAKAVAARPFASVPGTWRVRWSRIESASRSLSNTDPSFHWHDIDYRYVPMAACDDLLTCPADVRATILDDHRGLGTMAFRVAISLGERSGASTGFEKRFRGGLPPDLARVTVRRDDSYLGFLTELFNTPYIWGSAGSDRVHQAERRIGSDCADFVTYGVRRLGHDVPYSSTWTLPTFSRQLAATGGPAPDGRYLDAKGKPIVFGDGGVRPGDLLLFPGHVGALVRDEPPLGILSTSDVMIHTCWHEPAEQSLASSDYGRSPFRLLRWKALDR